MRNWIFVKVQTDQPGLHGWGEATLEWHTRAVVGAIEDISQLLLGEDPTRVEHLWQMMYRQHFWHGNGIVRGTAISGIDLALWDIVGKVHGVPCHKLWGGPVRDHVRLYSHLGGGRMEDFYQPDPADARRGGAPPAGPPSDPTRAPAGRRGRREGTARLRRGGEGRSSARPRARGRGDRLLWHEAAIASRNFPQSPDFIANPSPRPAETRGGARGRPAFGGARGPRVVSYE
ncbi:hypothetical protein HK102_009263 [Quaeritorhiza haematococci]|nr:hypothetical protein HK102_009263 [Quaeritorhiza haematococci]